MLPQNIFATLHQIISYSVAVLKNVTSATLCYNDQRYYQPRLNKSRMFDLHKLHLRTYPTGHIINVFASEKNLTLTTTMIMHIVFQLYGVLRFDSAVVIYVLTTNFF